MSHFVKPTVKRLVLPDGEFIEVKSELCVGDQKRLEAAGMKRVQRKQPNGEYLTELEIDWETFSLARAEVWIVDWSLRDEAGQPVPVTYSALKSLTPETFDAIETAISAHVDATAEEKKRKMAPRAPDAAAMSVS